MNGTSARLWRRGAPLLAAALAVLPACGGIPLDATAKSIAPLSANPPTPTSSPSGALRAAIYYTEDNTLVSVSRAVTNIDPSTLLTLVIQEPAATEAANHIINPMSPNEALGLANPNATKGLLKVLLPVEFTHLQGSSLYEAYGQIVYTLLDPVNNPNCAFTGVRFYLNGNPWPAYLPGFTVSRKPFVTRADYEEIGPNGASAPLPC